MNEQILVIGSNSFSGSHFCAHALAQGYRVAGVSRSNEIDPVFLAYRWIPEELQGTFTFYPFDLNRDLDRIIELVRSLKPKYVINFASQSMVAESWQNPDHWMTTNVVSTIRLHEGLRTCAFLEKYVHISTPEVYGSCSGLVPENTNYSPSTPYAVSRAAADMSLATYFRQYRFPVVFTRAANVYGPGQQLYRIVPRTIACCLTGEKLQLHGGGHSVRSFIHIRDVANGTLAAAEKGVPGEIYHFSTSSNISIKSLVETITATLGIPFEECVEVVDDRPGKDSAYLLDSSKAERELDWKAQVCLEEGITETVSWLRENLEILKLQPQKYIHRP